MSYYIDLLDSFEIPGMSFTAGSPGNPGTSGIDDGQLAYARPWPGAIVCRFVYPPEHYPSSDSWWTRQTGTSPSVWSR